MNALKRLSQTAVSLSLIAASVVASASPSADYFARFKYTKQSAIDLLKKADGKSLESAPDARALLDDLGYWKTVRSEGPFQLTPQLETRVAAQYDYLDKAFRYDIGDTVWVKAESPREMPYGIAKVNHRAQIVGHERVGGTDYFAVDVYVDGADKMMKREGELYNKRRGTIVYYGPDYSLTAERLVFTKTELDSLNSPGSSLPVDNQGEKLDWAGDQVWQKRLEEFKSKMVSQNFEIDFTAPAQEIASKQSQLMLEIFRFFKMNRNARGNNGQGIGLRSCGGGVCFDQALVLTYAVQAVGQSQGLKAMNLTGTTVNPVGGHGFVRVDIKGHAQTVTFDPVYNYDDFVKNKSKQGARLEYPGVTLKTTVFTGISDPGWADYGVTEDQFALMSITDALNTIPVDSNRAVNGLSHQRSLVDVAEALSAKGPLATQSPQAIRTLSPEQRLSLAKELGEKASLTKAVTSVFGVTSFIPATCKDLLGGSL